MTAREVFRGVDYDQDKPPDIRDVWMVRLSTMARVEHFARVERGWMIDAVRKAAADGDIDGHGVPVLSSRDFAEVEALVDGLVVKVAS